MNFRWDESIRRFRNKDTGRLIAESKVESWIDAMLLNVALFWSDRASLLKSGAIGFDVWYNETRNELISLHQAMIAVAFGGLEQTRDFDYTRLQLFINDQLTYFYAFAVQIYTEQVSEKMMQSRLGAYALAGFAMYQNSKTFREYDAGMVLYRRVTRPGDNCEDCLEYESRGYRPLFTIPPIGQSVCRSRCKCYWKFTRDLTKLGKKD